MAQRAAPFTPNLDHVFGRYVNPFPRTIARRGESISLDGTWKFDLDLTNRGLNERWEQHHTYGGTAIWPRSIESQLDAEAHGALDEVVAWYEREFALPAQWQGELVQVTFGAVGYETRVWLNGHPLTTVEGEAIHKGEYTSFSYELPAEYLEPVNRLTVRIADSQDAEIPRGKQASRVYKRGGIWYQTRSGALRSIWLEVVERNRLRSYLGVHSQIESNVVTFDLTTRIHDAGRYLLNVVVQHLDDDTVLAREERALDLTEGSKHQKISLIVPDAHCWEPSAPVLYRVTAQLIDGDGNVSEIRARWGMRHIEVRGNQIFLNNEPIYLDGILYQPEDATWEQIKLHLEAMSRLGCNLVRIHIAGIDPRMYDLADELGMLLWVEIPSPHSSSEQSRANHWDELRRMGRMIGAHPSVIIWSMYNEDWGIQDVATNQATRDYVAKCYDHLRLRYPQVLSVDNDGWQHVSVNGTLQSDLLTAHIYQSDIDQWTNRLDRLTAGDLTATPLPLVVGDPFFYVGQLPLVMSEWGGFGFQFYGGPNSPDERAAKIRAYKQTMRDRPIAGDVYTQATNIEDERNGLIDFATGELFVPEGILRTPKP